MLAIEIDMGLPAQRITRVLEWVAEGRGYPAKLSVDKGAELTLVYMAAWAETHGVELAFLKPGKSMQNGFIEHFNCTYREEVLDLYMFNILSKVRDITEKWITDYN